MPRKGEGVSARFFNGKCQIKNRFGISKRQKKELKRKGKARIGFTTFCHR